MVGLMIITLLKHADRVKIACLAQLVNVIAPIMTEPDGGAWRQTIFYPFLHASRYGRGTVLQTITDTPVHETSGHGEVTDVVSVAVYSEEKDELTIFAVNRNLAEDRLLNVDLRSFEELGKAEKLEMVCEDLKAENSEKEERVKPTADPNITLADGKAETVLKKASWNVIRIHK